MEDLIEKKDGELLQKHACDSSDYLIAVACGAVSGLVDIFLVGAPSQSVIGKWTDAQVDEAVKKCIKETGDEQNTDKEEISDCNIIYGKTSDGKYILTCDQFTGDFDVWEL